MPNSARFGAPLAEASTARIVRLLLLTGQRRDEVGSMDWSEIAAERSTWTLPSGRTKNGRPHEVPITGIAAEIIGEVINGVRSGFVFGKGQGPFSGWSGAKRRLDQRIGLARHAAAGKTTRIEPMPPWRLHDVRRTVATRMADLGTQPHVVEAVLNHVSGSKAGVAGIYNRAVYSAEKRQALTMWAEHIAQVAGIAPARVVALRRA